jgi:hypothetical protein
MARDSEAEGDAGVRSGAVGTAERGDEPVETHETP